MLMKTLLTVLLISPLVCITPLQAADHPQQEFVNKILTITDQGPSAEVTKLERPGSLVFFYNGSKQSTISVEVDYGNRRAFCSTGTMTMGEDGVVRSQKPIAPGTFAAMCFPDIGSYDVRIISVHRGKTQSSKSQSNKAQAKIIVE